MDILCVLSKKNWQELNERTSHYIWQQQYIEWQYLWVCYLHADSALFYSSWQITNNLHIAAATGFYSCETDIGDISSPGKWSG